MFKWVSVLALLLSVAGITYFWFDAKNTNQRIMLLESQVSTNIGEMKLISDNVDNLIAEKKSSEAEVQTLESNPERLIDVLNSETIEKGLFNIQTRISKVYLRNNGRFNVRDIQIAVRYVNEDQVENGVTASIKVSDILIAGQTKWFEVNSPWMDGRPTAKMEVSSVDVVGK